MLLPPPLLLSAQLPCSDSTKRADDNSGLPTENAVNDTRRNDEDVWKHGKQKDDANVVKDEDGVEDDGCTRRDAAINAVFAK